MRALAFLLRALVCGVVSWGIFACGGIAIIDEESEAGGGSSTGGGSSSSSSSSSSGGASCGDAICDAGTVCCNASCGVCTPPGEDCNTLACAPCDLPLERRGGQCVCPEPYHVQNGPNCVWSCGEGTQPDAVSNECVCQPGFVEVGTDQFGRRVCEPA